MKRVLSAALAPALLLTIATPQPALAHESRTVGPYAVEVGWLNEPALQGQLNAAFLEVKDTRASPAKPVEGLEETVTIQVFSGGLTRGFTGKPRPLAGEEGAYALYMIPTAAGSYRMIITGKIESLDVNETFESGPNTFAEIGAAAALQYPEAVPGGADLTRRLTDLQATADQGRIVAIGAFVLSLAALAATLLTRRRG